MGPRAPRAAAPPPRSPPRPGQVEDLTVFLRWVTCPHSQAQAAGGSDRAFGRRSTWCLHIPAPKPPVTGEAYSQVFIDALWPGSWMLLVDPSPTHVIAWQQAASEKATAYQALLADLAPPDLATTHGTLGALKPITTTWAAWQSPRGPRAAGACGPGRPCWAGCVCG